MGFNWITTFSAITCGNTIAPTEDPAAGTEAETAWSLASPVELPLWGLIALIVALLLAAALLVIGYRRRVSGTLDGTSPDELAPRVGKLHAQGAREYQQDCFSVTPEELYPSYGLLAVVADGMGGLEDGDQVSQTAVSAMMDGFYVPQPSDPAEEMLQLLYDANGAVNRMLGVERIGQCGSTVVAGLLKEGRFYFLSVGDSRICLYRDGALSQLNREHNYRRELELRAVNGEGVLAEAKTHPRAAGLTSYLGMGQLRYLDQGSGGIPARPGDRFVLMSDGVYNALTEEEMCQALALDDPQQAADALGQAVESKAWPGQDNYTAVIVQC